MRRPLNPYLVLATAVVLPGMGQVLNRQPVRGLTFVCFAVLLGGFTLKTAAPDVSFVGNVSGALFVWAMAVLDAYRTARIRRAIWDHQARQPGPPGKANAP
jgi:energy-converting hydrogenase Eha subunit C